MFPSILSRAVKDKVGNSKVIQAFKDTYDYVIGKLMYASVFVISCAAVLARIFAML